MKIGILGDLHLTNSRPRKRTDDYFTTQIDKLKECFSIFDKNNCDIIIQPGDFFDTHTVGNYVISEVIKVLNTVKIPIYCVWGNHDTCGHSESTYYRSPLNVLESAGVVKLLNENPTYVEVETMVGHSTYNIYGSSFGSDIPIVSESAYTILVTHRMIGDRPLYKDQEIEYPNEFMQKYKYSLTVCGDFHYPFSYKFNDRWIVNAGCLVRKSVAENDLKHTPSCVVFDTVRNTCDFHKLVTALPIEQVFDLSVDTDETSLEIESFVASLFDSSENTVDWKRELYDMLKSKNVNPEIYSEIEDSLKSIGV